VVKRKLEGREVCTDQQCDKNDQRKRDPRVR
jgi:hypothetical protein